MKIAIRRNPVAECWSWAVEWNLNLRVVGFFGDRPATEEIIVQFPRIKVHTLLRGPGHSLHYRVETPLQDADDKLFHWEPQSRTPTVDDAD